MSNFKDKIIVLALLILVWSCNFNALNPSDFKQNFSTIEHLRDIIVENNLLNDPTNEANYNLSYFDTRANSTKTPNCN